MGLLWLLAFLIIFNVLAYNRASTQVWTIAIGVFLLLMTVLHSYSSFLNTIAWILYLVIFIPLYATSLRKIFFTSFVLKFYRKNMPTMSNTEKEALAAGTVGWEGEIFCGSPDWNKLLSIPVPSLSTEEKAFLDGPVETLCAMIDDWDITHVRYDCPPEVWSFLKEQGFFSLIIPKVYGGKEFSAYAHSQILTKVYGKSTTVATTIAVPNSLGPAELLLHYGTEEQKNYYLPRLARGEEIPCFALTGPDAGSDAGALTDRGVVCFGEYQGQNVLGIRLNWNKRYITLAPVATVIGLAFKLDDPDHLLGKTTHLGITCALIPRNTKGVVVGRRHFPCNVPFQNGPTQGKDVFIPIEFIIGGPEMAGQGWRMLMECLAAGRAISLPSSAIGGGKVFAYTAGAYARIRRQFNLAIGRFEGIEEILARMMGYTYIMDATRSFTAGIIDQGEKPAVASAITKYHVTELGRAVANYGMDLFSGKGICLGPTNVWGRIYQSIPIAITVEGANILTRSMIIFGQGAMRCHPYVLRELSSAIDDNPSKSLADFDDALMGHMNFVLTNFVKTFVISITGAYVVKAPIGQMKHFYQEASRFSAAFALLTDVSMLVLGGSLKRRENISARLGDILSNLYLLSATLKHFHNQNEQDEDLPLVRYACSHCLYMIQQAIDELLKNFPNRFLAAILRFVIFPYGKRFSRPSDRLAHLVAKLFLEPSGTRARLSEGVFKTAVQGNVIAEFEDALKKVIIAEPIESKIKQARVDKLIQGNTLIEQAESALNKHIISDAEFAILTAAETMRNKIIAADDFSVDELSNSNEKYSLNKEYATSNQRYQ